MHNRIDAVVLYDAIFGIFGVECCGCEHDELVAWVNGVVASAITGVSGRLRQSRLEIQSGYMAFCVTVWGESDWKTV